MPRYSQPSSDDDYLWGAQAIADYIRRTKRQAQYLIEKKKIRVKRVGPKTIVGRKSEISADLQSENV